MSNEAKKKGDKLIEKFVKYTPAEEEFEYPYAIQCAITCVEEILDVLYKNLENPDASDWEIEGYEMVINYWKQIKQYLESKL